MTARIWKSPRSAYTGTKFIDLAVVDLRDTTNDAKYMAMLLSSHYRNARNRESVHNFIISSILNRKRPDIPRFEYDHVVKILETVKELFMQEGPLVETGPDIIVVGDLHGSLFDARRLYNNFRVPLEGQKYVPSHAATSFCFLGNYVDHGENSLEVLLLLFTMKLAASWYNQRVIMLRGNHETREMNYAKGFRAELYGKFEKEQADDLFEKFNDVFDHMPLACVIANRHLCVHGGISPKLASLDSIRNIPKPLKRVDKNKLARDLLWADFKEGLNGFEPNTERDISVCFGEDVLEETLDRFRLEFLIRSHQKVKDGADWNGLMITVSSYSGKNCNNTIGTVKIHKSGDAEMGICGPLKGLDAFVSIKEEEVVENPTKKADFIIEMGDN